MAAIHEGFHEKNIVLDCGFNDGRGFVEVQRQRLFAEDVLLRLRRADRPLGMKRMRRGDVYRLNLWIREQRIVAVVSFRDAELLAELIRRLARAAADGDERSGLRSRQAFRESLGD